MTAPPPPRIALYDLDRTITRRGTMSGFLAHVATRRRRWRLALAPLTALTGLAFLARLIDRRRLKAINLALLVGRRFDPLLIDRLAEDFAARVERRGVRAAALAQIARDRAEGFRIVIVTASFRLYVEPLARRLGIGDVIATELDRGRARVAGPNCYGRDKRALIDQWFAREGIDPATAEIRAYSDHVSDAPMLELARAPVAVSPSRALRRLTRRRGWTIADWDRPRR